MPVTKPEDIKNLSNNEFKEGFEEAFDLSTFKTVRKISCCSSCKRPILGHEKPTGKYCKYDVEASQHEIEEIIEEIKQHDRYEDEIKPKTSLEDEEQQRLKMMTYIQQSSFQQQTTMMQIQEMQRRQYDQMQFEMQLRREEFEHRKLKEKQEWDFMMEKERRDREERKERALLEEQRRQLEREEREKERKERNEKADNFEGNKLKCPKWKKEESLETFSDQVNIWENVCKVEPTIKFTRFLEAIEEHPKILERLKLETISSTDFDKSSADVVQKCMNILKKYFGRSKFTVLSEGWREFRDIKKKPDENSSEFLVR